MHVTVKREENHCQVSTRSPGNSPWRKKPTVVPKIRSPDLESLRSHEPEAHVLSARGSTGGCKKKALFRRKQDYCSTDREFLAQRRHGQLAKGVREIQRTFSTPRCRSHDGSFQVCISSGALALVRNTHLWDTRRLLLLLPPSAQTRDVAFEEQEVMGRRARRGGPGMNSPPTPNAGKTTHGR